MFGIKITRAQATPKRKPIDLRSSARNVLRTIDKALEPKPLTPGEELDAMLSSKDMDQRTALQVVRDHVDVLLREMDNA